MAGYEIQFSAGAGGEAANETSIASATELAVQIWITGAKLRAASSATRDNLMWFGDASLGTTQKFGIALVGNGSGTTLNVVVFVPGGIAAYDGIVHISDGTALNIASVVDGTYYVLYVGWTPTTGASPQECGVYLENGTAIDEAGRTISSANLPTTAGTGVTYLNFSNGNFSNVDSAGTYKRVAVWNKAIASASRTNVPNGTETGLLSLWGNANGFTAGSGASEPNQVSGGTALALSGTFSWNALAGGPSTPMIFHSFRSPGRIRRR